MQKLAKSLHVVAFDIPYPANYGGVIDIYYKLLALNRQGVELTLHCYQYGKSESKVLEKICKRVYYYPRKTFKNPFYGKLPYIVNSRNSTELLANLLKDTNPILFEGLHCTYYLNHPHLAKRYKLVRTHNIEHHYYRHLERAESKYFKKYFFRIEADRLKKHQTLLKHANLIAAISPNDYSYLAKRFEHILYLPAFHPNEKAQFPTIDGGFILYHGNLGVAENYEAATQLVKNVFSKLNYPCVIAGNNPPSDLNKLVENYPNIEIKSHISTDEIHQLIADAKINVLYTNQATGIKLKLLNALYRGKHVVVNPLMSDHTGLEELCHVGQNFKAIQLLIEKLLATDFSRSVYEERLNVLDQLFNNDENAKKLIKSIDWNRKEKVAVKRVAKRSLPQISVLLSYFFG